MRSSGCGESGLSSGPLCFVFELSQVSSAGLLVGFWVETGKGAPRGESGALELLRHYGHVIPSLPQGLPLWGGR